MLKMYISIQKFWSLMSLMDTNVAFIWSNYSKNRKIVKFDYNLKSILFFIIIPVMSKLCSPSLLQSSESHSNKLVLGVKKHYYCYQM